MTRSDVDEDLRRCVARGWNHRWHGERALHRLYPGVDLKLVARAMRIVVPWNPVGACRKLPDEHVPFARELLAKVTSPHAMFLRSYDGDLRTACEWLRELGMIDAKRNRGRLPELCSDRRALDAARATVVAHGAATERMLAALAHDGQAGSLDAMVDLVGHVLAVRDDSLDTLAAWFVPFARGSRMTALAAEFTEAIDTRGSESAILAIGQRFDPRAKRLAIDVQIDARQVRVGLTRKASAWVVLTSHALPSAAATVTWNTMNHRSTRWEDGAKIRDENALGMPRSVEDIPRWLSASARKLRVTWDLETLRVTSTLRGKSREAAVAWLIGG
jgi:hypothetical protein